MLRSRAMSTVSKPVTDQIPNIKLPQRLKGTIVEKWAIYWRQLAIDYKEMVLDTGKWMKEHPKRTTIYTIFGSGTYVLSKANPSLADFQTQFYKARDELILVSEELQNPVSKTHIRDIDRWYNSGQIRRLSIGIMSFIWLADYDKETALYKAQCEYLKPKYSTFHERIIDVGFWNKFWVLEDKMRDYDVNFD